MKFDAKKYDHEELHKSFKDNGYLIIKNSLLPNIVSKTRTYLDSELQKENQLGYYHKWEGETWIPSSIRNPLWKILVSNSTKDILKHLFQDNFSVAQIPQIALRPAQDPKLVSLQSYQPHIDGIPTNTNSVSEVYLQKAVLGIHLTTQSRPYMGNFIVYPGSHNLVTSEIIHQVVHKEMADFEITWWIQQAIANNRITPTPLSVESGDIVIIDGLMVHSVMPNFSCRTRETVYYRIY